MAKLSLQDQLLKSGLVGAGQAKAIKSEKHKQAKQQQHNKTVVEDDLKAEVQKARLEKADQDRLLNQQRKEEDERKHLAAQINQLIEQHRLPQAKNIADDSIPYHFTDDNKVKTLYLPVAVRDQLASGQLAIVKGGQLHEIVSAETARKIQARDASCVIVLNEAKPLASISADPYADYPVPDDLTW
jgi:uncharacterized protein